MIQDVVSLDRGDEIMARRCRIRMSVGKIAINTPNYKSVDFPKFAEN
jgi:hypothetical protein